MLSTTASFRRIALGTAITAAGASAYDKHRSEAVKCIRAAFEVADVLPIGSYSRGSAIRQSSDLDLLVVLRQAEVRRGGAPKSSHATLTAFRSVLRRRFPNTRLRRDRQVIVIKFADGRSIDIVPGWWVGPRADGWPLYAIPDGRGQWLETSPKRHGKLISDADLQSGGKLKHLARVFKFWRAVRRAPVGSFYVELVMAAANLCPVGATYAQCFTGLLRWLCDFECLPIEDPLGVSGQIFACASESQRMTALRSLLVAYERAERALEAERFGRLGEAHRLWNVIFKGHF